MKMVFRVKFLKLFAQFRKHKTIIKDIILEKLHNTD